MCECGIQWNCVFASVGGIVGIVAMIRIFTRPFQKALPYWEVPAAIHTVQGSHAHIITKLAFEFLILTAARSEDGSAGNVGGDGLRGQGVDCSD